MTRHTLHRFGLGTLETQAILQGLRERHGAAESNQGLPDL